MAFTAFAAAALGDAGREANIRIRAVPPVFAPMRSGPYPPGEALPERAVEGGVEIGGQVIRQADYDALKKSGFVPFRRELTDAELLAALKPEHRERMRTVADLAAHARGKFADYIPSLYWGFRRRAPGPAAGRAQETYEANFGEDGAFKRGYIAMSGPPSVGMLRWAASYWRTGDAKWARAVRDAFMPFHHANRPPLNKILYSKARGMWHVLNCGARVPFLVESYAQVSDSPDWSDRDHAAFHKAMLERGRFLRYTTVPTGPWPGYNPFGYGNWLLYQLQGLLAIAAYFPEFAEADDWLAHATTGIGRHADWGAMPDCGFDEYSRSYAGQVATQMEYCYNTFVKNRLPLPPRFRENILRLHELFLKVAHPARCRIPFGDTHRGGDPGVARCRWAALAFLDGRFKHFAGEVSDENIEAGARALHPGNPAAALQAYRACRPQPPAATSHILPETGWVVVRSGWTPEATVLGLAYRASARVFHSNWEMLGFNLWTGGERISTKLQGFQSYMLGYPDGFCRTPRQANIVILKNCELRRVAGSLRNWFSSKRLDYLHADHRGWRDGEITARRRLLFLKPDWLVIIDDIEGQGEVELIWQAHADEVAPTAAGARATIAVGKARAHFISLDAAFAVEKLPVTGLDKTVHLLAAEKAGLLPLRYVTLIHLGEREPECEALSENGAAGVRFRSAPEAEHVVRWEPGPPVGGRFVTWSGPTDDAFFASDGVPSPGLDRLLAVAGAASAWNGRACLLPGAPAPQREALPAATIAPDQVQAFAFHGRLELTPVGVAARVVWQTPEKARHSVLYRQTGAPNWQRQLQPDLHRTAWVLLPDLAPGAEYELKAVSELESGGIAESPIITRRAPEKPDPK